MRLNEYEKFVRQSDWTSDKSLDDRIRIARYGLAAEVGSLAATLKRKVIHHSDESWNQPNEEIVEELGDCLWYTTQLSTLPEGGSLRAVVRADFVKLSIRRIISCSSKSLQWYLSAAVMRALMTTRR